MKVIRVFLLFFISILFSIIISSCDSTNQNNTDQYDFEHDDQYYFSKPTISLPAMAESENGYYFFSGPNNWYLYYMDKKTMTPVVLCNKPDCLHSNETDPKKIQYCNAFFLDSGNLIYYYENLYVLCEDVNSNNSILYKVSLDGVKRNKIYTFKEGIQHLIIHRGYIYYDTNDLGTVGGNEANTSNTCRVYCLNINRLGDAPKLIFEEKGIYGGIGKIAGYKDSIYFMFYKFADSTLENMNSFLYRYSIEDNKIAMIKNNMGYFTFYNDKIIYADINKNLTECNLDGSSTKAINGIIGSPVDVGNYIYVDNMDSSNEKIIVYDWDGNIVKDYDNTFAKCFLYGGDDNYFFMEDDFSSHNDYGNIQTIYMIDKNKTPADADPIKVFEFVPKVHTSGVISGVNN